MGAHMLHRNPSVDADKVLSNVPLEESIRLEANRKILFSRFYLGLYNIGTSLQQDSSLAKQQILKLRKTSFWYNGLINVLTGSLGEAPVLVNRSVLVADSLALRNVCFASGFFHPTISIKIDTIRSWPFRRDTKKAKVTYQVKSGEVYRIQQIMLMVGDSLASDSIRNKLQWDKSLLIAGASYNQNLLIQERARITNALRNAGYFTFSPQLISYFVDTLTNEAGTASMQGQNANTKLLNVQVLIDSLQDSYLVSQITVQIKADGGSEPLVYRRIVSLRANELTYEQRERHGLTQRNMSDSLDMIFEVDERLIRKLNFNFIGARIHLHEGKPYAQEAARLTQQRLQELGMFRFAALKYELDDSSNTMKVLIDIQLAPHYQIKGGMESFYNGLGAPGNNLPSIGGNIGIRNRNAFDRSELLEFGLNGAIGFYSAQTDGSAIQSLYYGLGAKVNMNIPGLLFPYANRKDWSRLSPSTLLSSDVLLDQRREYSRVKVGARLSYRWNHFPFSTLAVSELTPLTLDYIDTRTDSTFQAEIVDKLPPAIRRDFEQRISSRLQYAFTYQDYRSTRARPTSWSRFSMEIGGNLPYLLDQFDFLKAGTSDTSTADNLLVGRLFYGQYLKASAEIKYQIPYKNGSSLVFRMLIGGAVPYQGTPTVPRESRFFSGGPNSMRGWRSNTLGPGTLSLEELAGENDQFTGNGLSLVAPGGEWIFETNAEYRFKVLPPFVELGLFSDLGNVWFHRSKATIEQLGEKAVISAENLKLGWDVGVGIRFDFNFLIFRIDFGQQLFAPDIGWIISSEGFRRFPEPSIGVDYPF